MADPINVKLLFGTESNFTTSGKTPSNVKGSIYLTTVDTKRGYLYFGDGTNFLNIVPKLLTVANGGTGQTTLAAGEALIGNGTSGVLTRKITTKTSVADLSSTSTNLVTEQAVYYYKGSSSISTVGTIGSGTWQGTTVAVGYGGTGKTTFTTNGVLYGNSNSALKVTAAGTHGQILSANSSGVPSFATPTFTWVDGTSNGPTLKFTIQSKEYTALIPSASDSISGIVTTGDQSFSGTKTFKGAIVATSVYPSASNTYTSGMSDYPWKGEHSCDYYLYDSNKQQVGRWYVNTVGTTSSTGLSYLAIGNNKAKNTAGNSQGKIYLYGSTAYASIFTSSASSSNKTVTIPNYTGNMIIGHTAAINPTTATSYGIPFYYSDKTRLAANNGLTYETLEGTADSLGYAILQLGNSTATGTAANKYGAIRIYGVDDEKFILKANPNPVNETETDITEYNIYLPIPDSDISELVYHPVNTSVGGTSLPVYISASGKPTAITTLAVSYGGTGKTSFTANGIVYGNSNSALKVTAAGTQGQIFSANSSGVPSFTNPSWSWTGGTTAGPTLSLNLHSKAWTTAAIPSASGSASGVITTGDQTFAGAKTFSNTTASSSYTTGAVIISGGLGVAGNIYTNSNINATGSGTFGGDVEIKGKDIYLGASTTDRATISYNNDTVTILFLE